MSPVAAERASAASAASAEEEEADEGDSDDPPQPAATSAAVASAAVHAVRDGLGMPSSCGHRPDALLTADWESRGDSGRRRAGGEHDAVDVLVVEERVRRHHALDRQEEVVRRLLVEAQR